MNTLTPFSTGEGFQPTSGARVEPAGSHQPDSLLEAALPPLHECAGFCADFFMKVILPAIGFTAVFEGLFPLIAPELWKQTLERICTLPAESIRKAAILLIVAGLVWIWLLTSFF